MKRRIVPAFAVVATVLAGAAALASPHAPPSIALPKPDVTGKVTLEQAIAQRRSVREYASGPLTLAEVSQLLWAAQGITGPDGKRATPSARAVYPLSIWLVANDVTGLPGGIYLYEPTMHAIELASPQPHDSVAAAAPGQTSLAHAAAIVAVVGDSVRAAARFGGNADRWLGMEAGFVVQDVYLECTALGLGTVMVGGFDEKAVHSRLGLPGPWKVLALMPVGRRK